MYVSIVLLHSYIKESAFIFENSTLRMADAQPLTTTSSVSPITVYWLNESRADRILFLLEELELPYNVQMFERGPDKDSSSR
jgi:hypothetical protein